MDKVKRWQLISIVTVVLLTLYNILPTLIYYTKPLSKPIEEKQAIAISKNIFARVDQEKEDTKVWLQSFCKNLGVKPKSITKCTYNPLLTELQFSSASDAQVFRNYLPRAGSAISFAPKRLMLAPDEAQSPEKVLVESKLGSSLAPDQLSKMVTFEPLLKDNQPTRLYKDLIEDRLSEVVQASTESPVKDLLDIATSGIFEENQKSLYEAFAQLAQFQQDFASNPQLIKRYENNFFSGANSPIANEKLQQALTRQIENCDKKIKLLQTDKSSLNYDQKK